MINRYILSNSYYFRFISNVILIISYVSLVSWYFLSIPYYFFLLLLVPQELFTSNERRIECAFRPYLLLTPPTSIDHQKRNEKINVQSMDLLSRVPSISVGNHEIYSTPNTFVDTPPNFDFDDYRLNESIKTSEKVSFRKYHWYTISFVRFFKDIHEDDDNNNTSCINNQIS